MLFRSPAQNVFDDDLKTFACAQKPPSEAAPFEIGYDFGEAVNAGTLDALKGELTVTSPESKTITLEPVKITAIAGDNVVTTDNGGSATVKYKKKV